MLEKRKERNLFGPTIVRPVDVKRRKKQSNKSFVLKKSNAEDIISDFLSHEALTEGQVTLGCISQVEEFQIKISLPHRLIGTLHITDVFKSYTRLLNKLAQGKNPDDTVYKLRELYHVGNYIAVNVKSPGSSPDWNVSLSLNPCNVNFGLRGVSLSEGTVIQCAVESVEDKGFVLYTGIPGVRGAFLRKKDYKGPDKFGIGSVFLGTVNSIKSMEDDSKGEPSVKVNVLYDWKDVATTSVPITESTTLSSIIPGSVCIAEILKICVNGLKIKVGNMEGFVYRRHLEKPTSKLEDYTVGQFVEARFLYKTLLKNKAFFTFNISQDVKRLIQRGIVVKSDIFASSQSGFYVNLPNSNIGFCANDNIENRPPKNEMIPVSFPTGKNVMCCVKFFHFMDRIYTISTLKTDLEESMNTCKKPTPGMMVDAEVVNYSPHGITVQISKKFNGFISKDHASETAMDEYCSKVPVGGKLNARVVSIKGKRVYLTLKKSLIESKLPIINSFSPDFVGKAALGTIIKIKDIGLRVKFYNDVIGFLHRKKLSIEEGENLFQLFKVGQVMKCYVKDVDEEKGKMTLTSSTSFEEEKSGHIVMNKPVSCTITSLEENRIVVYISDLNRAGILPMHNLSDDVCLGKAIFENFRDGDKINNAYIISLRKKEVILTIKPNTCRWVGQLPGKHIITEGEVIPVTVMNVMHEFLGVCSTPYKKFSVLKDDCEIGNFDENSAAGKSFKDFDIQLGQSLLLKINELKSDKRSCKTSVNFTDVLTEKSKVSTQMMLDYLSSEEILRQSFERRGGILRVFSSIKQGDQFKGKVIAKTLSGLLISIDIPGVNGGIEGVIGSKDPFYNRRDVNSKILVTVAHADFVNETIHLISTREKLNDEVVKKSKFFVNNTLNCEVVSSNKEYIIALLPSENNRDKFIYLPSKRHYNDFSSRHTCFEIGKKYDVVVRYSKNDTVIGELYCDADKEKFKLKEFVHNIKLVEVDEDDCKISILGNENLAAEARVKLEKVLQVNNACNKKFKTKVPIYTPEDDIPQFTLTHYWDKVHMQRLVSGKLKKLNKSDGNVSTQKGVKRKLSGNEDVQKKAKVIEIVQSDEGSESDEDSESEYEVEIKESKIKRKNMVADEEIMKSKKSKINDSPKKDLNSFEPKALQLETKGFCWDDNIANGNAMDESSSDEEEDEEKLREKTKKLSKAEQIQKSVDEEERLHQSELVRVQKNRLPESAMDYEELLQASPNSSAIWIQFISFHLQNAEIEKAKAIALRALQKIPMTEEHERLNVWTVLLRLEVLYGDAESLNRSFHEALATNNQKKIYNAMILIYGEADKIKEAEELYRKMCKKFSQDPQVWISAILFMFKYNNGKKTQDFLDKSLLSLAKEEHVTVIQKFAQFEFQHGDPEKGKTVYESLVGNYPKKLDIWGVYVDMLTKNNEISAARRILDRMTTLKLRLPKMRTIFKRLLQFEQKHGNETTVDEVKNRVQEYVNAALGE